MNIRIETYMLLVITIIGSHCGDDAQNDDIERGACVFSTSRGTGPNYCMDESYHFTSCVEFLDKGTCDSLGYDFCCEPYSGADNWRFLSKSEATRAKELDITDCVDNPTNCFTSGGSEPKSTDDDSDGSEREADECRINDDCPFRYICKSGDCVQVDCTSDAHCAGCYRCSDHVCRYCGEGPYGCYC